MSRQVASGIKPPFLKVMIADIQQRLAVLVSTADANLLEGAGRPGDQRKRAG
jgi:hypothetical protein